MDNSRFDALARAFATTPSRRKLIRGTLGSAAALLAGRSVAAKPAGKVTICHYTSSATNPYNILSVSASALGAHLAHGDQLYVNCCLNSECVAVDACTPASCVNGTCNTASSCGPGSSGCDAQTGSCGVTCLGIPAPCNLGAEIDQCCGEPESGGSTCTDVSDLYPALISRCCIPAATGIPCSGIGGDHCDPDTDCSICCTGYCGLLNNNGDAFCE